MKQAIYYNPQKVLLHKQERQLIFSLNENQELSLLNVTFSSEILSIPSSNMRMRCSSISY